LQEAASGRLPRKLQVFRPQCQSILTAAAGKLGLKVEATRRTEALKRELNQRASRYQGDYHPTKLEQPPPQALPDYLWGEKWRFATFPAGDLVATFGDRPIPIQDLPASLFPINLGIASTIEVPGVVIYGGRHSLQLARWLQETKPVAINFIPTEVGFSGGLVLEAGLIERWILVTFEDQEVATAGQTFEKRKQASQGLHFLVVQPDDSGMTTTGFWLLK
ncbi:MAG: DUF1092 family protein, partial [Okeania sp. SIO2D1]|nr:DUF1092 family protein [Okeania sp. SIO2D1]